MKLQECTTMVQAEQFLRGASPTFRKTVETAIALTNHADPAQRNIGQSFWSSIIQEQSAKLDKDEEPTPHHDYGIKKKGDHFVREETLAGGNKNGTDGSDQSSDNTEPYPQVADSSEDGSKDMEKMSDTENQMKEQFPMPGMGGGMPGMDPNLMKQMAPQMPQVPQMNTPQSIQQMQYTVQEALKKYVGPLREQVIKLTKANSFLAKQVREMQTMKTGLDLHEVKKSASMGLHETIPRTVSNIGQQGNEPRIYEKSYNLEQARADILNMDKMISSQN